MSQESGTVTGRASALWAAAITVAVMAIGPLMGHLPELSGFLVFLPAAAAGVCTVRQTAWVSVWTVLVTAGALLLGPTPTNRGAAALLCLAVACGLFATYLCRWRLAHVEAALRLQSAATAMQRHLLRPLPRTTKHVTTTGVHVPLGEDVPIGGDVYDVMETSHGTRVLIADVQGKGLGALGTSVAVVSAFRNAAHAESSVLGVAEALEKTVELQNRQAVESGDAERFVTAAILGIGDGLDVEVVNCGHPVPYCLESGISRLVPIDAADVPLGLGPLAGDRTVSRFAFPRGAVLVLFSDGLNEGRSRDGRFFPLEERLAALAKDPTGDLARRLWRQVTEFTGGRPQDDTTVLTVTRVADSTR
ncbi:PP2C family protein-serine/threonine phosphatase [Streptomyces sp. NPDC096094]|uniref:PP2C family protein-serine/threonine phosphatase n=1 Tax=Streptomyces sp. NPDC096094 TaxID=3366073 RepID=UPI0037FCC185